LIAHHLRVYVHAQYDTVYLTCSLDHIYRVSKVFKRKNADSDKLLMVNHFDVRRAVLILCREFLYERNASSS